MLKWHQVRLEYIPDGLKTFLKIVFAWKDVDRTGGNAISSTQSNGTTANWSGNTNAPPLSIQVSNRVHGFCYSYDEVKRYERYSSIIEHAFPAICR